MSSAVQPLCPLQSLLSAGSVQRDGYQLRVVPGPFFTAHLMDGGPVNLNGCARACGQAYTYWQKSTCEFMFIANSEVLVPDGVLTTLMRAMSNTGKSSATLKAWALS